VSCLGLSLATALGLLNSLTLSLLCLAQGFNLSPDALFFFYALQEILLSFLPDGLQHCQLFFFCLTLKKHLCFDPPMFRFNPRARFVETMALFFRALAHFVRQS